MLEAELQCPLLASGIPGFAPDERLPSKQPKDGVAMSLVNHLSARYRTEIHLIPPKSQADATVLSHEKSAGKDPNVHDTLENPLNIPTPSEPETAPVVTCRSAKA